VIQVYFFPTVIADFNRQKEHNKKQRNNGLEEIARR